MYLLICLFGVICFVTSVPKLAICIMYKIFNKKEIIAILCEFTPLVGWIFGYNIVVRQLGVVEK